MLILFPSNIKYIHLDESISLPVNTAPSCKCHVSCKLRIFFNV